MNTRTASLFEMNLKSLLGTFLIFCCAGIRSINSASKNFVDDEVVFSVNLKFKVTLRNLKSFN